ncbi:MAG: RDD family protein [Chlorobiota bacterium]
MNTPDNIPNTPQEGTPEYDQYMKDQFGEDYELGYRVGFGRRLGAYFIDFLFTIIIYAIAMTVTGAIDEIMKIEDIFNNINKYMVVVQDATLLGVLFSLLYYSTEIFFSASPGKMILGIRIGQENRHIASISNLVIRYLLKHSSAILSALSLIVLLPILSSLSSILQLLIVVGFFFTLSVKRQALHDILSKTAVYYKENIKQY